MHTFASIKTLSNAWISRTVTVIWLEFDAGGWRDGQICCLPILDTEAGSAQCKGQSSPNGSNSQGEAPLSHVLTKASVCEKYFLHPTDVTGDFLVGLK